jgi:hypothetical protein
MRLLITATAIALIANFSVSCVEQPEKPPVGPTSNANKMPWNVPQSGQGQGQFGMIPQMNQRR